ncbi:MAG TPA: OmpA family protein [Candidatus Rifleibacterium sp.]|nr:OmpA family protein [Candidatus Rifleibacterium sp.]HPT45759.1 OmpA family protein [Candidatus Rifleibacterium sp.]
MAKRKVDEVSAPLWCLSYGDMVTNMLCFFVMLFAFSSLDSPKKRQESESLDEKYYAVFSINAAQGANQWLTEGGKGILLTPSQRKSEVPYIVKTAKNKLARVPMSDRIRIVQDDQMVKIQIPANVLFESGSAAMKKGAEEVLTALVPVIGTIDNYVRVDGHTDDVPARNTMYPSNWELSTARACSVVRFFVEDMSLDAQRFSAQGYADNRPKSVNQTDESREANRRVEIIILNSKKNVVKNFSWD